ncbi:hypothetical protein BJ165DRAFT_1402623 [Panaeolus papilionaceus]|nr:hypothetical protein BJ165DRAFT_1402623 [Panaeolus papilionaceus]
MSHSSYALVTSLDAALIRGSSNLLLNLEVGRNQHQKSIQADWRHAAKARAKDAVGKIQKGYFGRQKLDVLSKSLSTNRVHEGPRRGVKDDAANKISLAHAKNKSTIEEDDDFYSYIPSPTRPTIRARNYGSSSAHTSSPNPRHSKILEAIDTSDPSFLRKTLDDILALPDLACLHSWGPTKSRNQRKGGEHSLVQNFASYRHGEEVSVSGQNKPVKSTRPRNSWSPLSSPCHSYTISDDWDAISDVEDDYPLQRGCSSPSRESMDHDQGFPSAHVSPVRLTSPSTLDETSGWPNIPARVKWGPAAFGELFNEINPWEKLGEILGISSPTKPVEDTEAAVQSTLSPFYEYQTASQEDAEMEQWDILASTNAKDDSIVADSQHSSVESNVRGNSADEIAGAVCVSEHEQDVPSSLRELLRSQGRENPKIFSIASQSSGSPRTDSPQAGMQGVAATTDFLLVGPDNLMEDVFDDIFDDGPCLWDAVDDCGASRSNGKYVHTELISHDDAQSNHPSHDIAEQEIASQVVQIEETLHIPELAELDGKYIGPALFNFSESEEE